jgi:TfoX/Sxy family transcriptional regulator of competence genes
MGVPVEGKPMSYDRVLTDRIRRLLQTEPSLTSKEMFGGLSFMLNGNMLCGVIGEGMIARIGPQVYEALLKEPGVREFDMTGRPMQGWVVVEPQAVKSDRQLTSWIRRAAEFVHTLPVKTG